MFNSEFYPTPPRVRARMVRELLKFKASGDWFILDPQAGKGDLLKAFSESPFDIEPATDWEAEGFDPIAVRYHCRSTREFRKLYAIEIEPELQTILRDVPNVKVIGSDFLTYNGNMVFDAIIMNPPFSNGDEHLLKAWQLIQKNDKGYVVCLLNAETVLNPYSDKRELLANIIQQNGYVEFLGKVFSDAERTTDVEVAMVVLKWERTEVSIDFKMKNTRHTNIPNMSEFADSSEVAKLDFMDREIGAMKDAMGHITTILKATKAFHTLFPTSGGRYALFQLLDKGGLDDKEKYNSIAEYVNNLLWKRVFDEMDLEKRMDSKTLVEFQKYKQGQEVLEFNKENFYSLLDFISSGRAKMFKQAILTAFDVMTAFYKDNQVHVEGWAHNDQFKVNSKVIIPSGVSYESRWGGSFSTIYHRDERYNDIDKAMSYLSGIIEYKSVSRAISDLCAALRKGEDAAFSLETESTFFKIKIHKKGTVHLVFKEQWLLDELNIVACRAKGWLRDKEEYNWRKRQAKKPDTYEPQHDTTTEEFNYITPNYQIEAAPPDTTA